MPTSPDANISTAPKSKPNVVGPEMRPRIMSSTDPTLRWVSVPRIKRIIEARDAIRKIAVASNQSDKAALLE